ncbi:MAG: hypothetical protein BWX45_00893 [Deltaproteobacteria bacterium ADurb.Bin002]|nr:MAG: hypothetical protein BWX45_00893 [Deltaproteobacteria bacterium ADurb.Bin002]
MSHNPRAGGRPRIVRDHDNGFSHVAVEALHHGKDLLGGDAVEIARRLVGDQNRRIGDNGPGDGHALLLAAGHLPRIVVHPVRQPHHRKRHLGVFAPLFFGKDREVQRQLNVLHGLENGNQVVELKDEAHRVGPPGGQLRLRERGDVDIAHMNAAGVGPVNPRDQIEKCCFARTGRPHERQKFSRGDVKRNIEEHRHDQAFPLIGFVKIPNFHNRLCLFGHGIFRFTIHHPCHGSTGSP